MLSVLFSLPFVVNKDFHNNDNNKTTRKENDTKYTIIMQ